jgi:prophage regulatory protein
MTLLSLEELRTKKGISYSRPHLYRLMKANAFVKPIRLGANRIAFVEAEVDSWIQDQISKREVA